MNNNLILMKKRLNYFGGKQQDRMIKDKYKTFQKTLLYSYQSSKVKKQDEEKVYQALINPHKLKPDYDDKIISIDFAAQYKPGDIFQQLETEDYWLICLQQLTEKAYFRGEIRRCSFEIKWLDQEGQEKTILAAVRGPVETRIENIQIHKKIVDIPNHSLHILMPSNEDTLKKFRRYSKFYLQKEFHKTCWRVEAIDSISMPGVLELTACEYYANKDEDDIDEGVVGAYIQRKDPNPPEINLMIEGESFIKPHKIYRYTINNDMNFEWFIDKKYPVEIIEKNNESISLRWNANYSSKFDLLYGDNKKIITVESLF